jgi:hypothetical protein
MFYPTSGAHGYYIDYMDQSPGDRCIAGLLNISLVAYHKILKKFNGCQVRREYYFETFIDCKNACDYLEQVFGVMLKLTK